MEEEIKKTVIQWINDINEIHIHGNLNMGMNDCLRLSILQLAVSGSNSLPELNQNIKEIIKIQKKYFTTKGGIRSKYKTIHGFLY